VSLFAPESGEVRSELCGAGQRFLMIREVPGRPSLTSLQVDPHWWEMEAEETGWRGVASRHHFHPCSEEGECWPWHLGPLHRAEAEELLVAAANGQGAFLVRHSPDRAQLVLSVKSWDEEAEEYAVRHYPVVEAEGGGTFRLSEATVGEGLDGLVASCRLAGLVQAACLLPNPTSDPALLRGWELQSQPDAWMIPRWLLVCWAVGESQIVYFCVTGPVSGEWFIYQPLTSGRHSIPPYIEVRPCYFCP
jgi:hypothetical protein